MPTPEGDGGKRIWSWDEEKTFENAIADGAGDDRWEEIASRIETRTAAEVKRHYEILIEDIESIESGNVPIPRYAGEEATAKDKDRGGGGHHHREQNVGGVPERRGFEGKGSSKSEQERRKGIPWTEEEHRLFLLGLGKFGKGDWRSISRNYVVSRNPTQVASHAQKYFIRLTSMNRDRRRSSIHDITTVNGSGGGGDATEAPPQGPITGHSGAGPAALVGSMKQHPPHPHQQPGVPAIGMYGPPMGHPVTGHLVPAVGTPVMLPPGHPPPYAVPLAYPVPPPPMHQ